MSKRDEWYDIYNPGEHGFGDGKYLATVNVGGQVLSAASEDKGYAIYCLRHSLGMIRSFTEKYGINTVTLRQAD